MHFFKVEIPLVTSFDERPTVWKREAAAANGAAAAHGGCLCHRVTLRKKSSKFLFF